MGNPTKMRSMQNLRSSSLRYTQEDAAPKHEVSTGGANAGADKAAAAQETASEASTADKTASSTATLVPDDERHQVDEEEAEEVVVAKDGTAVALATVQETAA
jgi:hypothetical protein